MNKLLTTVLRHQLAHKLVHKWVLFQHQHGSKKIVYVLPSFLAGFGVGYFAAHYKTDANTILENFFKYTDRADRVVESSADNKAEVSNVETKVGTDELVSSTTENQTDGEIKPEKDDKDK